MNILDVDIEEFEGDKLDILFEVQRELCKKFNSELLETDLYTREGQKKIKETIMYAVEELMELSNRLKIRPWTKTIYLPDINEIYDELADSMLMMILVSLSLGIDSKKLFEICLKKVKVNEFRERTMY